MSDTVVQQPGVHSLKFADKHIQPILGGQKTATLRLDLDGRYPIGDRLVLCDADGERFASAFIDDRGWTTVNMAAEMDIDGHRRHGGVDELIAELENYYPEEHVRPETKVEIVYWDYEELWE